MTKIPADRRLVRLFESATDAELSYGLTWYADAHDTIASLADETGVDIDTAAAVVAALSPRTSWPDNLRKARQVIETGTTYGLTDSVHKAQRILAGEAPLEVLGGRKVRSFYDNLRDPLGTNEVTIDSHAFDAWSGQVTSQKVRKHLERKGGYDEVADAYRSAARVLGVKPHVVQAVVWAVWRNRFGGGSRNLNGFSYQRVE